MAHDCSYTPNSKARSVILASQSMMPSAFLSRSSSDLTSYIAALSRRRGRRGPELSLACRQCPL